MDTHLAFQKLSAGATKAVARPTLAEARGVVMMRLP
jgi:hypothetical protein